jgi:trimeric autotransporter adhesin
MKSHLTLGLALALGFVFNAKAQTTYYGTGASSAGTTNAHYGAYAGASSGTGLNAYIPGYNTFIGYYSGYSYNSKAGSSTMIGAYSGYSTSTGRSNVFLGYKSGYTNTSGGNNTYLGINSGYSNTTGEGNVFIGYNSGYYSTESNTFVLDNSNTTSPFLYGDITSKKLAVGGITTFPATAGSIDVSDYSLFVKGGILTEEVRVTLQADWADYVFAKDYKLPTLKEVEGYIDANGHLPNMPSAQQVKEDGIGLGEMSKMQQEKIEELTLYLIEQQKEIETLKAQVKALLEQKQ